MTYLHSEALNELIRSINANPLEFGISSPRYQQWQKILPDVVSDLYQRNSEGKFDLELFGKIHLPYVSFGNINSSHLFGLDEIILFVFYWKNQQLYHRTCDLGANIGLHSLMMSRCGFDVDAYEPDPNHIALFKSNIANNHCTTVALHESAVSSDDEHKTFIRVVDNTTGSHLAGMKQNPYGDLDTFTVKCTAFNTILATKPSLIKMDIEGAEADVISNTVARTWQETDMLLEVGTELNASLIWNHLNTIGVNMFSQKRGWQVVQSVDEVPTSYKEGSLFITMKDRMPW